MPAAGEGGDPRAAPAGVRGVLRTAYLAARAIPKTLLFNLRYFPPRQALRFPVVVSHRVRLRELGGTVTVKDTRFGTVRIGFGDVGIFDARTSRTIWQVTGHVEFAGRARIGHGSRISVRGTLRCGDDFRVTAEGSVIAHRSVSFGDGVLVSWETLVMDTDFHTIRDAEDRVLNDVAPVEIGNRVWIGCRCLVLKGVRIADGVIVAAGSNVIRSIETPNAVAAGNPARVVRENVDWKF